MNKDNTEALEALTRMQCTIENNTDGGSYEDYDKIKEAITHNKELEQDLIECEDTVVKLMAKHLTQSAAAVDIDSINYRLERFIPKCDNSAATQEMNVENRVTTEVLEYIATNYPNGIRIVR